MKNYYRTFLALLLSLFAFFTANTALAQSKIFWNEQMGGPPNGTIYSSDLDGSAPDNLFPLNDLGPIRGLAVDPINKKIYWSDSTNNRIRVANFDGSGAATAVGSLASNPASLAVDPAAGKIYWCSEGPGTEIFRADFDGSNMEELFDASSVTRGIALDVAAGKMYFALHDLSSKILRADLDGAVPETVIASGTDVITSLALDPDGGKMYWVDLGLAEIHRANLDGSSPELLVIPVNPPHSIGLDVAAGKMYWSELDDGELSRADLDGSNIETLTPAMPNRPEFLGLYIAETSTFAGMTNTSLGGASMSLDLSNHLVISNIGASGLDGVSFFLGQAQFGELDFGSTLALSPGAFVQASAIGSLNNVPGQTIGTITLTGVSGGNTNVQFDLSAVSIQGPCLIVYNGATQVFLGVVPGNSVEVAGVTGPCLIPFQPQSASGGGANALATVFLRQKLAISIPGGPTVTGDRIVALAENISASVEYVSDISVIGANLSSFTLEAEALGLFNTNLHAAQGAAQITSNQQPTSQLTVSNLGASLLDGVDIDVEEAGVVAPCVLVELAAVPLSGVNEQVHFSASSPAIADFGAVDLLATGSGFDVNVDYSAIGASMVEVMVFNAGVPVGSALVPAGNVGTITPASGPIALTRTFVEATGHVNPCAIVGFQQPVSFAFASTALGAEGGGLGAKSGGQSAEGGGLGAKSGGQSAEGGGLSAESGGQSAVALSSKPSALSSTLLGDEIHFHSVNPTIIPSGIASVKLLMANVPEFTIINEATEAPSPRVFVSNGAITIDRSKHSASKGDLHSNATITFKKGDPTTFTGNLTAVGSITINKDNTIAGNATSASTITVASGASITGITTPNGNVASISISTASFSAGGANITVPKNGTRTINPGSYGNVIVGNSAKLNMSSGEYRFVKLETQSTSYLNFDVSNGAVQVKVTSSLKFGKEVTITITPGGEINSSSIEFTTLQSAKVTIDKEGYVFGTFLAPNAEIFVGKNTSLRGLLMANKITVDRDVIFWPHSAPGTLPLAKVSADDEATSDQQPVTSYELSQNYPNPFNPSTTIRFALPEESEVSLRIYNLQGQLVREVVNSQFESGRHSIVWDGKDARGRQVASGVYVYRLKAGSFIARKKLLLMK